MSDTQGGVKDVSVEKLVPITRPSVANPPCPEFRLPWRFTYKIDGTEEEDEKCRFVKIPPPAEPVAAEAVAAAVVAAVEPEDEPPKEKKKRECCKCTLPKMCEVPEFSTKKKLNWCFIYMITLACALSGMQIGGALFNDAPLMHIIQQQQGWADTGHKNQTSGHPIVNSTDLIKYQHYFTTVSASSVAFGSLAGGKAMNYGRRLPMILMNIVGIAGCFLSVYPNYFLLIIGRAMYCFSAGVMIALVPRILEEVIPAKYTGEDGVELIIYDKGFGASTNLAVDGIVMINSILVMFMPKVLNPKKTWTAQDIENNYKKMGDNHLWKYLYLIPIPLLSLSLFICICCFRHESVGFLVSKGKKAAAIKALKQIFMGESDEEYEERYKKLLDQVAGEKPEEEKEEEAAKEGGSYEPPCEDYELEGGQADEAKAEAEKAAADAKAEAEKAAADAKAQADAALAEAKNWRKKLPAFLQTKPGEISVIDALTHVEHRSGTWLCFALAFFNVMSGITIMLVYFNHIFDNIDSHK